MKDENDYIFSIGILLLLTGFRFSFALHQLDSRDPILGTLSMLGSIIGLLIVLYIAFKFIRDIAYTKVKPIMWIFFAQNAFLICLAYAYKITLSGSFNSRSLFGFCGYAFLLVYTINQYRIDRWKAKVLANEQ